MPEAATPQFPPIVLDHIYGEALESWYQKFSDEQHILSIERDVIDEAVWNVYTRASTLDGFMKALEEEFGTPERAKEIAIPILGNDFLKIEDYLGIDISAYITHLGGDPTLFVKEIPMVEVVRAVMGEIGAVPAEPILVKRLEIAITAYLSGVRDALETKDVLVRSAKVGGVGFDAATADRVTNALEKKLRALRDAGVVLRKGDGRPPEESAFHLVRPAKSGLIQPEDEDEIEQLRNVVPGDVVGDKIRSAIDRIIQKTGAKFKNEDVTRRFRMAIESRLRDIRDYRETLDLLTKTSVVGGFGIPEPMAKKVLAVVEGEAAQIHRFAPSRGAERRGILSVKDEATTEGPTSGEIASSPPSPRNDKERAELPAPTTAITSQLVHPLPPRPLTPPPPPPITAVEPMPPAPKRIPIAQPAPVPLPVPKSVPMPSPAPASEVQRSAPKPTPSPAPPPPTPRPVAPPPPIVRKIPIAKPPPVPSRESEVMSREKEVSLPLPVTTATPPSMLTPPGTARLTPPGTAHPTPASGKPKLQDIRSVPPRLVGPIEEIQRLTIQDFRKIAKVPAEAAARIAEKLALLEKDSYTKRADGVKALRGSALMVAYAEIVNAAFLNKRKVDDLIAERLQVDKQALTLDEFHALMGLNAQLRF